MTTSFWNANEGKSVPSGGATQLTTAAAKGDNLGNWLSKVEGTVSNLNPAKLIKIVLIIIALVLLFKWGRKHGK